MNEQPKLIEIKSMTCQIERRSSPQFATLITLCDDVAPAINSIQHHTYDFQ
jgi:hypothetical protein